MDIWEANSISAAYTPHPCTKTGPYRCSGTECNTPTDRYNGICDPDGCDFNSFRQGDKSFYGPGLTVDTKKKFTVVTQFITSDGTANGSLKEIRRIYIQDGKVIQNSKNLIAGLGPYDSITEQYCTDQKAAFGDTDSFKAKGGMKGMEAGLRNGMVLALSIWDDHNVNMLWLDSTYPTDSTKPGAARGTCPITSGDPKDVEANVPNASVVYSNIKVGDIGTTYTAGNSNPGSSVTPTSTGNGGTPTSTASGPQQTKWGQWSVFFYLKNCAKLTKYVQRRPRMDGSYCLCRWVDLHCQQPVVQSVLVVRYVWRN